jgi:hypothetical protein
MYRMHACPRRIWLFARTESAEAANPLGCDSVRGPHPPTHDRALPACASFLTRTQTGIDLFTIGEQQKSKEKSPHQTSACTCWHKQTSFTSQEQVGQENQYCFTHAQSVLGVVTIIWARCCEDAARNTAFCVWIFPALKIERHSWPVK